MEIQYNALYECPRFPHNFKVLSSPNEKNYLVLHVNLYLTAYVAGALAMTANSGSPSAMAIATKGLWKTPRFTP